MTRKQRSISSARPRNAVTRSVENGKHRMKTFMPTLNLVRSSRTRSPPFPRNQPNKATALTLLSTCDSIRSHRSQLQLDSDEPIDGFHFDLFEHVDCLSSMVEHRQ